MLTSYAIKWRIWCGSRRRSPNEESYWNDAREQINQSRYWHIRDCPAYNIAAEQRRTYSNLNEDIRVYFRTRKGQTAREKRRSIFRVRNVRNYITEGLPEPHISPVLLWPLGSQMFPIGWRQLQDDRSWSNR